MKQTSKNIVHASFHLLLLGGLILAVDSLKPPDVPQPDTQPTAETAQTNPHASQQLSAPKAGTKLANAKTHSSNQHIASLSPKHDSIKEAVQREYIYRMFAAPNDPEYSTNWALAKVNAPAAWDVTTGNGQTVVAVIDGGYGLEHEDLTSRWHTNTGETGMTQDGDVCWTGASVSRQANLCDDDQNGYVDDWRGWSFIHEDSNPQAGRNNPAGEGTQHGTQVSGLVGAAGNNGVGIAAINWNTKIMPLQALDDEGVGYTSDVTAAVYYAVDNGADVINLSLGAYANDPAMMNAVNYASANNVVVVAAAGNCGDGGGEECAGVPAGTVAYPAAYPDVIAVGAATQSDQRASFSSYGPSLDVVAPGYGIPASTTWSADNQTSLYSGALYGTSFASPQVASLAALIKSIRPSSSVADITALIDATGTKPSAMNGLPYTAQLGHGIINAASAINIATVLNASGSSVPNLLQAGSYKSEHTAPAGSMLGSGCQTTNGSVCTIQMTNTVGHRRYLPYTTVSASGAGWSWSADMIDADIWELRARHGDNVSTTPYFLFKKG